MNITEAKEFLIKQGYEAYPPQLNAVWNASKKLPDNAHPCESNGNKISWHVSLYEFPAGATIYTSAQVEICGEFSGAWFKLDCYSIDLVDLDKRLVLQKAEQFLLKAWQAIHN